VTGRVGVGPVGVGPVGVGPVGVALVGCAHRPHAWSYARALSSSSSARLVGVYDVDAELGHSVADDFGAPYTDDVEALVAWPEVQAVVVCSPTSEHRSHVELAASYRRHVLCEKPIATRAGDARAMVAAADAAGIQLHVAFVSRFMPHVRRVKEALDAGTLGTVIGIRAGNRGRPPLPPSYPAWITTPELSGGGALIDHSVHLTDLLRHLTGQEVERVAAETGSLLWDTSVEDCALLSLVLDGGAVASVDPSWSVPANNPWDYDFFLHLVGSNGSVDVDDVSESVKLVAEGLGPGLRLVGFGEDVDAATVEAFVASVVAGEVLAPCATGLDGLRALEVALAGYASAADGARFVIPA
jgi:predicted dehydrogenase